MAYVELKDNSLPPLPKLPVVKNGKWVVYGNDDDDGDDDDELQEESAVVQSQN